LTEKQDDDNMQQTDHAFPLFCRRSKAQRTKKREGTAAVAFRYSGKMLIINLLR